MAKQKLSPKILVIEYFESLVNRIDIHTEEQLNKYSPKDLLDYQPTENIGSTNNHQQYSSTSLYEFDLVESARNPYENSYNYNKIQASTKFIAKRTQVCDYLNGVRDEMIEHLKEAEKEAIKNYEAIRSVLKDADFHSDSIIKENVFAKRFLFIVQVDNIKLADGNKAENKSPFKLYLVDLDFYMTEQEMLVFKKLIDEQFASDQQVYIPFDAKPTIKFDKKTIRSYLLYEYLKGYFKKPKPFVHVLQICQSELFNNGGLSILCQEFFYEVDIVNEPENNENFNFKINLKSLGFFSYMRRKFISRLNHLSGFSQLEYFHAWEARLFSTSFIGLSRLKRLDLNRCDFKGFARDSFKHIANLEILKLWDPRNYDHIDFSHLYSLQCLEIGEMTSLSFLERITSDIMVLKVSQSLKESNLEEFLKYIQRLTNIQALKLFNNYIRHFDIKWLSEITNLKQLSLYNCGLSTINLRFDASSDPKNEEMRRLGEKLRILCDSLVVLDISKNYSLKLDQGTFKQMSRLEKIDMIEVPRPNNFNCLFGNLRHLKHLDF